MSFGKVVQVMGPSVDIEFEADQLPLILNALEIDLDAEKRLGEAQSRIMY